MILDVVQLVASIALIVMLCRDMKERKEDDE